MARAAAKRKRGPLWAGPDGEGPNGGVTFGLLSRWLTCRERCRIQTIEGLRAPEQFVAPIEFGNLWHACEEALATGQCEICNGSGMPGGSSYGPCPGCDWRAALKRCTQSLMTRFPSQQQQVAEWSDKCSALFPLYLTYWERHPDNDDREQLFAEETFDVRHRLPSGRLVRLRGKRDSVDLVKAGRNAGVWVQENKSKSGIDQGKIDRQLRFDLQTMIYFTSLVAEMSESSGGSGGASLRGVRYNVVQRSSHKIVANMIKKVTDDVRDGRGAEWFARWNVEIGPEDVSRFRRTCLDPLLENVADDWEWWSACHAVRGDVWNGERRKREFPHHVPRHYVHPFGVRNVLDEGGSTDLDECVTSGREVGLKKVDVLFPELA